MPNYRMSDLTRVVQDNLPEHVQQIYQEAFSNAWQEYADSDGTSREESCAPGGVGRCKTELPEKFAYRVVVTQKRTPHPNKPVLQTSSGPVPGSLR